MHDTPPAFAILHRGLRKLRLIFSTWYPWNQRKIAAKLRPLRFRKLEPEDIEWCLKLYGRNERCGVPESGRPLYEEYLATEDHLVLIAEVPGGRLGTFGIHWADETTGYISYLLVDPGAHRSGVGTTMMLAAIALLGTDSREKHLMLTAFDAVLPFYQGLGFRRILTEKHEGLPLHHLSHGPLSAMLVVDCIEMLRQAGVHPDDLRLRVPFSTTPAQPLTVDNGMDFPIDASQ